MSEDTEIEESTIEQAEAEEMVVLKQRARIMGVNFSNNIGLETLRERVRAAQEGETNRPASKSANPLDSTVVEYNGKPMSLRHKMMREQMKLVRCRIQNLDPKKKDLPGEIFTVGNEVIGTVRKFIPYGEATDGGYHVPYILYKALKNRKFLNIRVTKKAGREHVEHNLVREFAIEVLPQLTREELDDLKKAQMAAGSVD